MRSKNVLKNASWGILYQFLVIILGFISRTFFIKYLGAEYLGISGLFTNILTLLSLTELGFSSAISFHLYGHLARNEKDEITGIMNYYKSVYRIVALAVTGVGLVLVPFLQFIIGDTSFSLKYVTIVYILYLANTVSSYLFTYNNTLIIADQKDYKLTQINIISRFVVSVSNILILIIFQDFVIYLATEIVLFIFFQFIKAQKVKKLYPYINRKIMINSKTKKRIWGDVKNIFAGKVSTVVVTSTDNIIISVMTDIVMVGLYSNYSMIIGYIQTFLSQFTSATQASLGNMFALENKSYSNEILRKLSVIEYFATSFCTTSLVVLLNPFIKLWIGNDYLLPFNVVVICVLNFYIQIMKTPLWFAISGLGYFKEDRNIAIYGAISNLMISVIAAHFWGLFGVFFGTAFSQLSQWGLKLKLYNKKYLKCVSCEYLVLSIKLALLTVGITVITYCLASLVNVKSLVLCVLLRGVLCAIIPNILNFLIFRKTEEFAYILNIIKKLKNHS